MKRLLYTFIITLTAIMATGCHKKEKAEEETPRIDVAEVVVDSVTLTKSYPGFMAANTSIKIVARVNGTLRSKGFNDGDVVRKGQVLFTIDPSTYADAVREAEAQLQTAQSAAEYARSHYEAVMRASQVDAVSEQELAQAKSNMEQANASVRSASAQLNTARTRLGYCTITAPVTGRIGVTSVNVGSYVSGEGEPFVLNTVYDDSSLSAVFEIEDAQHLQMLADSRNTRGVDYSRIPLSFDAPLSREYTGNLNYVAPDVDQSTGTIEMKATVDNPDGELRDGMFVTVTVPYGFNPRAILVKDASIATDQLGRYVYTVNDSNRVVYTPIKVGEMANDSMRIVLEGLTAGTRYVTKALLKVRPDMEIEPVTVK